MKLVNHRWLAVCTIATTASIAVAGCSSGSSGSATQSGGPTATSSASVSGSANAGGSFGLTVGVLHAFTGQNAFFGLNAQNSCKAAALNIDAAGGILGHSLTCSNFDTKGDPADAVPVTNRMLVSASHLVMVLGPDGGDIPSVLPVLEQAKVPEMNTVGDPRYDTQTSQDFWRLTPSDSTQAPALAYYTHQRGFTKIAEVFTSDLSASTTTTPFQVSYTKLGGTIVKAVTITPDASSYQTEVASVLAAHPQAIVGEMDSQTAATFLSEMRQQNGSMLPVIMTQRAIQGDWEPSVGPAIGLASMGKYVTAIAPALQSSGAAFTAFTSALTAIKANPFQAKNPFVAASYDGVTAFALAMEAAKSVDPNVFTAYIPKVTTPGSGAVVVSTYAQGVAALKAGKTIDYVGAAGAMVFNQNNTANRPYAAWAYNADKHNWIMGANLPANAGM
ncbi:ABC transporter substrate-binding protein [Trebonia kvetii]|uniref:ABC transporter substrate-binding protein n=1 Tax=Trebonia kvetii TaxID=2480626 RepID=A0A6P2C089_9ACTN|nr:ABC transporter substrate-binding protein [Trebonia kvetii]TVZ04357.1 ABC transporter substrate-binding protein [Trebonia kvetii]